MKILLIEYEPRYLEKIRGYLEGKGFELVVARDGDEGLAHYQRSRPDLVLVSSVLPRLRTPDVIRGMQASGTTPPILLMMSGYKGRNKRADAQRIGAWSILEKPFGEEVFMAEVQAALGLRPAIDLPAAGRSPESGEPLLSADDIFSDILSGIDEAPPAPVPPAAMDPALEKRLETTLAGLIPPKRGESSPGFVPPRGEAARTPAERPAPGTAETAKVNVGDLAPGARAPEKAKTGPGTPASVDKLLQETLSGLKIRTKTGSGSGLTDPGVPAPPRPASSPSAAVHVPPAAPAPEPRRDRFAPPPIAPAPDSQVLVAPPQANTIATPPVPAPERVASRASRPPSGPGAFGRYQLLERIASGGMADVFKARMSGEEGFEKIVAIKRILPHLATNEGFITMFVDEAKLAAQLSHNNVIHIYELGKVDAWHYIAMEYVDGKDLRSILKMGRDRAYPLPVELSLFITSRIANALDYAHRRVAPDGTELNLVHRDVSPQNILISWEGDIKLCDFGVAKAATKVSTTMSGALKGKLQYMSPEQAWGKKIDRRSDIFSLGAVLFEMLAGHPLFEGENDMTILEKVRDGQVEPPSTRNAEVPRKVDQIVLKALAKNAQDRYQNASEFEKDLLSVLYGYQPSPGPADLAIYVHRLLETPASTSDDDIDAAFAAAQQPLEVTPSPKKGRGLVRGKSSGEQRPPAITVPAIAPVAETRPMAVPARKEPPRPVAVGEGRSTLPEGGESRKSRAGLMAGIGVAAVALVAAGVWFARGRRSAPAVPAPAPAATAVAPTTAAPAPPPAAEGMKVVDQKAVEAEAKRLAAEAEKARKEAEKKTTSGKTEAPAAAVPGLSLAAKAAAEPPRPAEAPAPLAAVAPSAVPAATAPAPTVVAAAAPPVAPSPVPTARPAPTEVSVAQAPPTVPPPAAGKPNVGDLVGPGEGVVEPKLVRLGEFTGLPEQARLFAHSANGSLGIVVLMALVDENGNVADVRLIRPSAYKFADDAAVRALRSAKITPATKDGVKVKMWSTFAITVKP